MRIPALITCTSVLLVLADAAFTFGGSAGGSGLSFLSGDTVSSIFSTVPTTTTGKIALARVILGG